MGGFGMDEMRSWPPRGGRAVTSSDDGTPPEAASTDLESLVRSAVSSLSEDKTAALRADVTGHTPTSKDIWRHASAHPLVLVLMLLDRYGQACLEWEPEVLKLTMERDGIAMSNRVWNKILAGRVVLNSPSPWRQWEVFHWVCRALNGETPNFVYLEQPEIGHLAVGYDIMRVVDPKRITAYEVDKFVAVTFKSEGILYIPEPLSFAQRELEEPKVECKTCDALHRDDHDTTCVSCGSTSLHRPAWEFAAQSAETKRLFDERRSMPLEAALEGVPDTGVGNAVYRLLVEWDLVVTARAQLAQQLRMLGGR